MKSELGKVVDVRRRVDNLIRLGVVAAVDLAAARVRVRYGGTADDPVLSAWLPWLAPRAGDAIAWWPPAEGEQVAVAAPSGELSAGVVLGSLYSATAPPPAGEAEVHRTVYADGALVEYDAGTHALRATLPAGGTVVVTGNAEIDGAVDATGALTAAKVSDAGGSLAALRAVYNTHTHPGLGAPPAQQA